MLVHCTHIADIKTVATGMARQRRRQLTLTNPVLQVCMPIAMKAREPLSASALFSIASGHVFASTILCFDRCRQTGLCQARSTILNQVVQRADIIVVDNLMKIRQTSHHS